MLQNLSEHAPPEQPNNIAQQNRLSTLPSESCCLSSFWSSSQEYFTALLTWSQQTAEFHVVSLKNKKMKEVNFIEEGLNVVVSTFQESVIGLVSLMQMST